MFHNMCTQCTQVHEVCQRAGALALVNSVCAIATVDTVHQFDIWTALRITGKSSLTPQLMVKVLVLKEWQASVCI